MHLLLYIFFSPLTPNMSHHEYTYVWILNIQLKNDIAIWVLRFFPTFVLCYMRSDDDVCDYKCHCSTAQLQHFYTLSPPDGNKHCKTTGPRAGLSPAHSVTRGCSLKFTYWILFVARWVSYLMFTREYIEYYHARIIVQEFVSLELKLI